MIVSNQPAHRPQYTFHEYVLVEEMSNVKHEFLGGEIYAMAGGTPEHAAIASNVGTLLNLQLRGKGCRVHSSDLRVRVVATGLATYPDVTVVCGRLERDAEDRNTVTNPIVVVEVLSPSSRDYDRGDKLDHYKKIASLRDVLLVDHDQRLLEVWRRTDEGAWQYLEVRNGAARLESINCELAIEDVYRNELAPAG